MTLVELLIGLAITATVMMALSAATLAVTKQWYLNDGTQSLAIQGSQIYNRVNHLVSTSLYICQVTSGSMSNPAVPAGVLLWAFNGSPYTVAQKAAAGELEYIYYDGAGTLWLYAPIPYASMNSSEQTAAATQISYATISTNTWPTASFMKYNYCQPPTVIGRDLSGVYFNADWLSSTTQRPALEFAFNLKRAPYSESTQYNVSVLRAPSQQPN
jgi:hypothetical protein